MADNCALPHHFRSTIPNHSLVRQRLLRPWHFRTGFGNAFGRASIAARVRECAAIRPLREASFGNATARPALARDCGSATRRGAHFRTVAGNGHLGAAAHSSAPSVPARAGILRESMQPEGAPPRAGDRTVGRWSRLEPPGTLGTVRIVPVAEMRGWRDRARYGAMAESARRRRTCGSDRVIRTAGAANCEIKERAAKRLPSDIVGALRDAGQPFRDPHLAGTVNPTQGSAAARRRAPFGRDRPRPLPRRPSDPELGCAACSARGATKV